jgi:hypothetical protein
MESNARRGFLGGCSGLLGFPASTNESNARRVCWFNGRRKTKDTRTPSNESLSWAHMAVSIRLVQCKNYFTQQLSSTSCSKAKVDP